MSSWVSRYIVPCPGDSSCKHCKPGEPHPQQHTFSKLVHETKSVKISPSLTKFTPQDVEYERHLRKQKLMGTMFGNLERVKFDPTIDPEPYACFVCWSFLHMTRDCQESVRNTYCRNCGRKDVEIDECPRCSKAYREYFERKQRKEQDHRDFKSSLFRAVRTLREEDLQDISAEQVDSGDSTGKMDGKQKDEYQEEAASLDQATTKAEPKIEWSDVNHNDLSNDRISQKFKAYGQTDFKADDVKSPSSEKSKQQNELFTYMRNQKVQDQVELDQVKRKIEFNSESDYYFYDEEDENYDDYVVDEGEKSESLCTEDYTVRFFVDLLASLKHLSIEMQNTAVLNFVSERKQQIWQKETTDKSN